MSTKMNNGVLSTDVTCSQNQSNSQPQDHIDNDTCKKETPQDSTQRQKKIQCPHCTKFYKQKYILNTHIKSVHKINPHYCSECKESYGTIQEYKDHLCKALHPELVTDNKGVSEKKNQKLLEKTQQQQDKQETDNISQYKDLLDQQICQKIVSKLNDSSSKFEQEQVQKKNKINQNPAQQINEELIQKVRNQNNQQIKILNLDHMNIQQKKQDLCQNLTSFQLFPQNKGEIQLLNNTNNNNNKNMIGNNFNILSNNSNNNDDSASFLQDSIHQTQILKGINFHSNEEESSQTQLVQQLEEDKNKLKLQKNLIQQQQGNKNVTQQHQQQLQQQIFSLQQQLQNESLQNNLVQQLLYKQQENYLLSQLLQKQQFQQINVLGLGIPSLSGNINSQQNIFQQQHQLFPFQQPSSIYQQQQQKNFIPSFKFQNNNMNALKLI